MAWECPQLMQDRLWKDCAPVVPPAARRTGGVRLLARAGYQTRNPGQAGTRCPAGGRDATPWDYPSVDLQYRGFREVSRHYRHRPKNRGSPLAGCCLNQPRGCGLFRSGAPGRFPPPALTPGAVSFRIDNRKSVLGPIPEPLASRSGIGPQRPVLPPPGQLAGLIAPPISRNRKGILHATLRDRDRVAHHHHVGQQ